MRILLLAPEIVPPYTEGRKRFVIDLARALSHLNHQITLLSSGASATIPEGIADTLIVPASNQLSRLFGPLTKLPTLIADSKPDVVVNFPYGTFNGLHFLPSRLFLALVDGLSRLRGVPCFTVTYSIDRKTQPGSLTPYVSRLVTGDIQHWDGPTLPFGRDFDHWPPRPYAAGCGRRLLFLAGMWQTNRDTFDHVLRIRGLLYLLRAGATLSLAGVSLHVAAPLLASRQCRDWLLEHPENYWPLNSLTLSAEVTIPTVFFDADIFVFPYAEAITQFTPTSVIESMLAETPVVLSDFPFMRQLADDRAATFFPPRDSETLSDSVLSLLGDVTRLHAQAQTAGQNTRRLWGIDKSANELLALIG